jgi:hypothetical protein
MLGLQAPPFEARLAQSEGLAAIAAFKHLPKALLHQSPQGRALPRRQLAGLPQKRLRDIDRYFHQGGCLQYYWQQYSLELSPAGCSCYRHFDMRMAPPPALAAG